MKELRQTLQSINRLSDSLNRGISGQDGSVDKLNAALANAGEAFKKLSDASARLDTITRENGPALREFSQRGLGDLTQLITETRQLVAGLSRLAGEIERDPARFFFGDRREGYRPR
jgi:phospholipid/cholesterol/gamma-HCH transport system substrate-binding protein